VVVVVVMVVLSGSFWLDVVVGVVQVVVVIVGLLDDIFSKYGREIVIHIATRMG
jgi:hypothetical protein